MVNTACGYCFLIWAAVVLTWASLLFGSALAVVFAMMAGVGSLLGLPRAIQTGRGRFMWVPVGTLVYLVLCVVVLRSMPRGVGIDGWELSALGGVLLTFLTSFSVFAMARQDFAKPVPAWVCRSCGYTLLGLREPACPECGERFDPDRVPDIVPGGRGAGPA